MALSSHHNGGSVERIGLIMGSKRGTKEQHHRTKASVAVSPLWNIYKRAASLRGAHAKTPGEGAGKIPTAKKGQQNNDGRYKESAM